MQDLQLEDYREGYRFRLSCRHCSYGWYENPADLLASTILHSRMYLEEVSALLACRQCRKHGIRITTLVKTKPHHFSGGIA